MFAHSQLRSAHHLRAGAPPQRPQGGRARSLPLSIALRVTPAFTLTPLALTLSSCESAVVYRDIPLPLDLSPCLTELSPRLQRGSQPGAALEAEGGGSASWSAEGELGCIRRAGDTPQGCLLIEGARGTSLAQPIYIDGDGMHLMGAESVLVDLRVPSEGEAPASGAFVILAEGGAASEEACAQMAVAGACEQDLGCALKMRFWLHESATGQVLLTANPALESPTDQESTLCEWVPLSRVETELCDGLDNDCDGLLDEGITLAEVPLGEACETQVGACPARGLVGCAESGEPECVTDFQPSPEACDGVDNDCDGVIDNGFALIPELCDGVDNDCDALTDEGFVDLEGHALGDACDFGVGACAQDGVVGCVDEEAQRLYALPEALINGVACLPLGAVRSPAEGDSDVTCDGVDSDCDGFLDEGFTRSLVSCGEGACVEQGQLLCLENMETDTCRTGEPAPEDVTCDGADDDCSGQSDEDFLPDLAVCGLGECVRTGTRYCFNNEERVVCAAAIPVTTERDASCNNRDEDCDGLMDEGFMPTPTACGVGVCAATGERRCDEGGVEVDTCSPGAPTGADATCDGVDTDCDGRVDEGFRPSVVTCGVGVCAASGQTLCDSTTSPPRARELCTPAQPPTLTDLCDGADNDCDGRVDEDHSVTATACGDGVCRRNGQLRCVGGALQDTCLPSTPQANETDASCNNSDDDCDGTVDESYTITTTTCGATACAAEGLLLCANGSQINTCREGSPAPNDATCDGEDDDCDNSLDEDYIGADTSCGRGLCASRGAMVCSGGALVDTCTPGTPQLSDATCDGIDQDCDGAFDEGFIVTSLTCGVGECRASGVRTCVAGQTISSCSPGAPVADTSCDQRDNDCDGRVDEAYPTAPISCGVGACAVSGQRLCAASGVQDVCTPLAPAASDPVCDRVDADCDGRVDENYTGTPVTCGVGACANTTLTTCVNGAINNACTPNLAAATPDTDCDLIDDDCDGKVDEAYASTPVSCPAGSCSANGQNICTTSGLTNTCVPIPALSDTTCNGVDEDCDGRVDDDYVPQVSGAQISCGFGPCVSNQGTLACVNGSVQVQCTPNLAAATPDTLCDGVDQDCDSRLDEAYSATTTCGVGACERPGVLSCVSGGVQTACTPGMPADELCGDLVDNDCDGQVDEFVGLGASCTVGVGACARQGVQVCNQDRTDLVCNALSASPNPELCNGIDDNCDGVVDNATTDSGAYCASTQLPADVCIGTIQCVNATLQCRATNNINLRPNVADEVLWISEYPYYQGYTVAPLGSFDRIKKITYNDTDCGGGGKWVCYNRSGTALRLWCYKQSSNQMKEPRCDKASTYCCDINGVCE
jgi:hypothetical protein